MTTTAFDDQFLADKSARDDLLDKLAMELDKWPSSKLSCYQVPFNLPNSAKWTKGSGRFVAQSLRMPNFNITKNCWLQRREELINCPPDSEAPEWATHYIQKPSGEWLAISKIGNGLNREKTDWRLPDSVKTKGVSIGKIPAGHRWQDTLTRINRDDNTSTPEEEEAIDRVQARQNAERPHEADARRLDEQWKEAMVECGCGDKYPINSYGAGFTVANDGVCENCDTYSYETTANSILNKAAEHMQYRAATYDKPEGERSMSATVAAFNSVTGDGLMNTEERGWLFMQLLKAVRSQQGDYRADSYEDGAAYVALAGEAAAKNRNR